MQNSDSCSSVSCQLPHRNTTIHSQAGIVYPRQDSKCSNVAVKFPPLIIEDETKNYVDGIIGDEDDSDGEPDTKLARHSSGLDANSMRQKKTRGRVKIKMEFIENKLRRYTTFSKRKTGIMKKAYELSTLTGTQVMLLVASETGHVYTFATRKLQPMITSESGKALIQTCLNSPDPTPLLTQFTTQNPSDQRMSQTGYEEPDLQCSTGDEDVKPQTTETSQPVMTGIQFTPGGHGVTTYIHQPAQDAQQQTSNVQQNAKTTAQSVTMQTIPSGSVTAIIAPGGSLATASGQTIQVQPQNVQPQIIQGQLQMHKIHPQNILLSGNMPSIQAGHIIISPNQLGSQVVIADNTQMQSAPPNSVSASSNTHDNIIIVPSGGTELSSGAVQMIYNTPNGLIYASPANAIHSHNQANSANVSESVTIHHQPAIQTAASYHIHQEGNQSASTTTVIQTS